MNEKQLKILNLLKKCATLDELQGNLSDQELIKAINKLKAKGYNITDIYKDKHTLGLTNKSNHNININNNKDKITFFAIADTHLLSSFGDINAIDKVYDYAKKYGINYFIHLGDFIDGNYEEKEFAELLKNYPKDKEITTLLLPGNHDYIPLNKDYINIFDIIKSNRIDIIPVDNDNKININNSIVELSHQDLKSFKDEIVSTNTSLILKGHQHIYKTTPFVNCEKKTGVLVNVPALSNMIMQDKLEYLQKGFLKITLQFGGKGLKNIFIENYSVENDIQKLGENSYQLEKVR